MARDSPVLTLTFFTRLVLLCLSFLQGSIRFPRSGWPPFYRESGCKDKGFLYSPPNIFATFFHIFFAPPRSALYDNYLPRKLFSTSKRANDGPPSAQKCLPSSPDISGHGLPYFSFKRKSSAPKSVPPADETGVWQFLDSAAAEVSKVRPPSGMAPLRSSREWQNYSFKPSSPNLFHCLKTSLFNIIAPNG